MKFCSKCGIANKDTQAACFLCGAATRTTPRRQPGKGTSNVPAASPLPNKKPARAEEEFSKSTVVMLIVLSLIAFGLVRGGAGGVFTMVIFAGFLMRALRDEKLEEADDKPVLRGIQRALTVIGSIIAVMSAITVALFIVCVAIFAGTGHH